MQGKWQHYILKMTQFLSGRNGFDKLSGFLLISSMLINGVNSLVKLWRPSLVTLIIIPAISFALLAFAIFRMLSRNVVKRHMENFKFENLLKLLGVSKIIARMSGGIKNLGLRIRYRKTHRFRTCPNCKEFLRLKKKRGRRGITCPNCRHKFKVIMLI